MSVVSKQYYLDKTIDFLICDIVEYDMKSAGFSVIKEHQLLPPKFIQSLEKMPKEKRNIIIGKLNNKPEYKGISTKINSYITEYRVKFYEQNNLVDEDILSVKKDAIFVKKYCPNTTIFREDGTESNIRFVPKNTYSAYLYLDNKEFYYSYSTLDIKGISDDNLKLHEDHMVKFIRQMIGLLTRYDYEPFKKKLISFINNYKTRQLPIEYYREFNDLSQYNARIGDNMMLIDQLGDVSMCDISYNFSHIIIPLLGLVL